MADLDPKPNVHVAQLVQQPLCDEGSNLVETWKAPFAFGKGAFVAVEANPSVYRG